MVNLRKQNGHVNGLKAHDKVEGNSPEGRAVFAEVCSKLSEKQRGKIAANRVLKGERRVTRDLLIQVMELAGINAEEQASYWQRYFGGAPTTIPEFVRRRMIIAGGRKEYAEQSDLSPSVLSSILKEQRITHDALCALMAREPLPWTDEGLIDEWKKEYEEHLSTAFGLNQLGARVETLFAMHPQATRTQWVDLDNPPASLKDFSANERRKMMSAVRHGRIETWERADRVLVGLGCTLKERIHVAKAWLAVKRTGAPPLETNALDKLVHDDRDHQKNLVTPIEQSQEEYPEEFEGKSDTEIIAELLRRYTESAVSPSADEGVLDASIESALLSNAETQSMTREQRSAQNAKLALPMAEIRIRIAQRWQRISEILDDFDIKQKPNLTEKILSGEASSERIREEIQRILRHELPDRAKAGELVTLLGECEKDAIEIQLLRNTLASENTALIGSFFQQQKFANYYADALDFQVRRSAAERGLLRACDTFNPATGELSTFVFVCIKSQIRREAEQAKKEKRASLDREFSSDADGGSLLTVLEDRGVERPVTAVIRSEVIEQLHTVLGELQPQLKRSVELLRGLDITHPDVTAMEAAEIMNAEGLRTMAHERLITGTKVIEWAKLGERLIAKGMSHHFGKKKGDNTQGALE